MTQQNDGRYGLSLLALLANGSTTQQIARTKPIVFLQYIICEIIRYRSAAERSKFILAVP